MASHSTERGLTSLIARSIRKVRPITGQISLDSSFGREIRRICELPEVRTAVEIGCWEGNGSTRVLRTAFANKPPGARVVSLEANQSRATRAKARNRRFRQVNVIWGSVVDSTNMDRENLSDMEWTWFQEDEGALNSCPNVLDQIPSDIDFLLLDGGEFSTHAEYQILSPRVNYWLALDDTQGRKCGKIADEIRSGRTQFEIEWESAERNGSLIARRRESRIA